VSILHLAPGASIAVTELHEINGAIEFGAPAHWLDFSHARVNLHKRTGTQQGIKSHVVKTDVAVEAVANVKMLNEGDGHFAPDLDEAGKQIGVINVEGTIETNGEGDGALFVVDFQIGEVRVGERGVQLVAVEVVEVDPVEQQQVGELDAINGAERVNLEDAGNRIGVFDLREPGVGDVEFGIAFSFRDALAEVGDVPGGDAQTATNIFQAIAGGNSPGHAASYSISIKV